MLCPVSVPPLSPSLPLCLPDSHSTSCLANFLVFKRHPCVLALVSVPHVQWSSLSLTSAWQLVPSSFTFWVEKLSGGSHGPSQQETGRVAKPDLIPRLVGSPLYHTLQLNCGVAS